MKRRAQAGKRPLRMKREHVLSAHWHASRAFSSAVKVTGGTLVFLAGVTAVDGERRLVGPGDSDRQVEQVWENMRLTLEQAGAGWRTS